jgi:hypothetical protein
MLRQMQSGYAATTLEVKTKRFSEYSHIHKTEWASNIPDNTFFKINGIEYDIGLYRAIEGEQSLKSEYSQFEDHTLRSCHSLVGWIPQKKIYSSKDSRK